MKFLETLMPPKFYRYMYHKMVIMAVKFGNREPYSSCVILMFMTTIHQFYFIVLGIGVVLKVDMFAGINTSSEIIFMLGFMYVHYLLFYYKGKHLRIMEEFKDETPKQTKKGIIYLFIYIFICFFVLFALWGWFVTLNNPNYQ